MAIGTAGFTAMLAVMALEAHGRRRRDRGEVLVTGAAGGVGSVATAILARRGYQVVASTGRAETHEYLRSLGAARSSIARRSRNPPSARSRPSAGRAASIRSAATRSRACSRRRATAGSVAAVGLAGGSKLEHTVIPFLLRGVNLLGIDSVMCPRPRRIEAWSRLQTDLPLDRLALASHDAPLAEVPQLAADILKGQVRGRTVIDVNA